MEEGSNQSADWSLVDALKETQARNYLNEGGKVLLIRRTRVVKRVYSISYDHEVQAVVDASSATISSTRGETSRPPSFPLETEVQSERKAEEEEKQMEELKKEEDQEDELREVKSKEPEHVQETEEQKDEKPKHVEKIEGQQKKASKESESVPDQDAKNEDQFRKQEGKKTQIVDKTEKSNVLPLEPDIVSNQSDTIQEVKPKESEKTDIIQLSDQKNDDSEDEPKVERELEPSKSSSNEDLGKESIQEFYSEERDITKPPEETKESKGSEKKKEEESKPVANESPEKVHSKERVTKTEEIETQFQVEELADETPEEKEEPPKETRQLPVWSSKHTPPGKENSVWKTEHFPPTSTVSDELKSKEAEVVSVTESSTKESKVSTPVEKKAFSEIKHEASLAMKPRSSGKLKDMSYVKPCEVLVEETTTTRTSVERPSKQVPQETKLPKPKIQPTPPSKSPEKDKKIVSRDGRKVIVKETTTTTQEVCPVDKPSKPYDKKETKAIADGREILVKEVTTTTMRRSTSKKSPVKTKKPPSTEETEITLEEVTVKTTLPAPKKRSKGEVTSSHVSTTTHPSVSSISISQVMAQRKKSPSPTMEKNRHKKPESSVKQPQLVTPSLKPSPSKSSPKAPVKSEVRSRIPSMIPPSKQKTQERTKVTSPRQLSSLSPPKPLVRSGSRDQIKPRPTFRSPSSTSPPTSPSTQEILNEIEQKTKKRLQRQQQEKEEEEKKKNNKEEEKEQRKKREEEDKENRKTPPRKTFDYEYKKNRKEY